MLISLMVRAIPLEPAVRADYLAVFFVHLGIADFADNFFRLFLHT